jgi:transcriptional regulator with XRE-family HTH domain
MNSKKIGQFIASRRKELGMTQSQLADQLHVSDGAVSKWERGINFPDIAIVEHLAAALDLSVIGLLNGESQTSDHSIHDAIMDTLHYSSEVETRIVKKSKQTLRFWQGLLVLLFTVLIIGKPLLRVYQDQKSAVSYENIKKSVIADDWFGVVNGACDFGARYFGSSHVEEMNLLCITAQEKWARQNFGQLLSMSDFTVGEVDQMFALLKRLGFNNYGSVTYWSGNIDTIGTLRLGYMASSDIGDLFVDYDTRKIVKIYIANPFMHNGELGDDFVLFTDQDGILKTFKDVELEILVILERINNPSE